MNVCRYLGDAASKIYGNGSHQFVENAVPSLIEGGLVHTPEELLTGIEILLERIHPLGRGEHLFETVEKMILDGSIQSLDDLRHVDQNSLSNYQTQHA